MELLIISVYTAICIAVFTLLRIPLNRWTVPTASIGGLVMVFALIQVLNYYHPYSSMSRQYVSSAPVVPAITGDEMDAPVTREANQLVAWFHQNSLSRLSDGGAVEVTFDTVPGRVFSGQLRMMPQTSADDAIRALGDSIDPPAATALRRFAVLVDITDPRYASFASQVPGGSHARTAVYGEQFAELAVVRKTLLRMSAWMNYLSLFS